jgi:hypothetical protein
VNTSQWSFYRSDTGEVMQRWYKGPDSAVADNTPEGCMAIEGTLDPLSQQVDLKTGKVVDYQPPQPSKDYEWDVDVRRWRLTQDAQAAIAADSDARTKIAMEEAASLRSIRELLLDPTNTDARAKLQATEDAIEAVRIDLVATEVVKP